MSTSEFRVLCYNRLPKQGELRLEEFMWTHKEPVEIHARSVTKIHPEPKTATLSRALKPLQLTWELRQSATDTEALSESLWSRLKHVKGLGS